MNVKVSNKMCSQAARCVECDGLFNITTMVNLLDESEECLVCQDCCDFLENGDEEDDQEEDDQEEEVVVHLIEQ